QGRLYDGIRLFEPCPGGRGWPRVQPHRQQLYRLIYAARPDCVRRMIPALIRVEIVYALPYEIWRTTVEVEATASVREALQRSDLLACFADLSLESLQLGIYGQRCSLHRLLQAGDRIEI